VQFFSNLYDIYIGTIMRIEPTRISAPILPLRNSAIAQSAGTQSSSGTSEDLDSRSAPPPNEGSPLIIYLIQDPEIMKLYFNLNNQPLPQPEDPPQQ
jgi:hypothetical protein